MAAPVVSIIIPVFNKWEYTAKCLRAVAEHTRDVPHEVIVVDNASTDQTVDALPRMDGVRILRNASNLGFARASNQGAALATGRFLLFLNNDTEPLAGWAAAMVDEMARDPGVSIVGSKLLYPDGTIQHAGVAFAYAMWQPITPVHVHSRQPAGVANARRELEAVTAACMLVRPEVFRAVGGFDEGYVNGYEDVDLCLEVRSRGGRIVFTPASVVIHHESVSEGRFDGNAANTERLMTRWIDRFDDSRFDADFRRAARPLAIDPARPGVSVIVVADRSIWTIAPCLENIWYTTGAQDEIVIVDDSGGAAAGRFAAHFAARHPDRVRVVASAGSRGSAVGFQAAVRAGLAAATRATCALVGPNVRVVGDWLGPLAAHLTADETVGAITATLGESSGLSTQELLAPVGRTDPNTAAMVATPATTGASLSAGARPALVPVTVAPSFTLFARTARLRAIARADPEALFGSDPLATGSCLAEQQLVLARAPDVVVYRLNQIVVGADPVLRDRYLELQGKGKETIADAQAGDGGPPVSVVVVTQGDGAMTRRCLRALHSHTALPCEIIVVDNGATSSARNGTTNDVADAADEARARGDDVTVIANTRNQGFAFACNQGLDRARGRALAIVHDDVVVGPGWMRRVVALLAAEPAVGMVGPASNECPGAQRVRALAYTIPNDGGGDAAAFATAAFATLWAAEHQGEVALVPRLAGMCLVMRREVVMRVGGFDTSFGLGKGADDDLSVRVARAGWKLAIAVDVFVHHQGGVTYRKLGQDPRRAAAAGWEALCAKWGHSVLAASPADLAALGAGPFDLTRDRVPLRYEHIYCPEAPPLALACQQPLRFLCIADEAEPAVDGGWRGVVLRFVQAFTARDPVALVVRVEPATAGAPARTMARIAALLGRTGISLADAPEVLFEATPLPPARRGSLYTAARFFLRGDGPDDPIHVREATACGLTVVAPGLAPAELRRTMPATHDQRAR